MVGEISSASQEQAQGVSEINKAMNQLDQVTQQNTAIAQNAATSAEQLSAQAKQLRQMVRDLFIVINGTADSSQKSFADGDSSPREQPNQSGPSSSAKVIPIGRKRPGPRSTAIPLKMAAGAESSHGASHVPSRDDPRFEDV